MGWRAATGASLQPLDESGVGDGAPGAFRLIEARQARHILQKDEFGSWFGDEIGVGQNDVDVAGIQRKRLGEEVPGALSAEVCLLDTSQSPPGAGVVRVQGDGCLIGAGGLGEIGAAELDFAGEAEQGIVGADGERGTYQAVRLIGLAGAEKLARVGNDKRRWQEALGLPH